MSGKATVFRMGRKIDYNGGNAFLQLMYRSAAGRAILSPITLPCVSKLVRFFLNSPLSVPMIGSFIEKNGIDMSASEKQSFHSFNDFFTRKLVKGSRPFDSDPNRLCATCDGKLTAFKINEDSVFEIKGTPYTVSELLHSRKLAERYKGGWCFIFRLEPSDYHRYVYIDNGVKTDNYFINGRLHTVQPIAINRCKVFKTNCREFTLMKTRRFGDVVQIEVGALCVGKISNSCGKGSFKCGEEKGLFEFGGSTIIQLFKSGTVSPDYDILMNTASDMETPVKQGEAIGYRL